jgi:hypothetical protein
MRQIKSSCFSLRKLIDFKLTSCYNICVKQFDIKMRGIPMETTLDRREEMCNDTVVAALSNHFNGLCSSKIAYAEPTIAPLGTIKASLLHSLTGTGPATGGGHEETEPKEEEKEEDEA